MEQILQFAQSVSPIGVIALLVIVILQLLNGKNILGKIRGTQQEKYPKLEQDIEIMETLKQITENHLHELPEMKNDIKEIKVVVDKISGKIETYGNRIIRLETLVEK